MSTVPQILKENQDMPFSKETVIGVTSAFICFLHHLGISPQAFGHGEIHEQIQEVTQQIEKDSTNALLYLRRAELYRYHHDWDAAFSDYDQAERLDASLDIVDLGRGKALFEAGMVRKAKTVLDRFLIGQPDNVEGLLTRARTQVQLEQYLSAAVDYTQAITHSSDARPEYYLERARALVKEGADYLSAALRGIDEGLARLGAIVTLQLFAIDLQIEMQDYDGALERLESIAQQSPRKERWLFRRGEILLQAGRAEAAYTCFQQALHELSGLPEHVKKRKATQELEQNIRDAMDQVSGQIELEDEHGAS